MPPSAPWREFARAPLMPVAVATAVGLVADRYAELAADAEFLVAVAGLAGWYFLRTRNPILSPLGLWLAFAGASACHHHIYRNTFANDDIGNAATLAPAVAKVRGIIDEAPTIRRANHTELFGPLRRVDRAVTVLAVTERDAGSDGWQPASGLLRISIDRVIGSDDAAFLDAVRTGDEVELVGLLARPGPPGNPGEHDYAEYLLDKRIRAELRVTKATDSVVRLDRGVFSLGASLASLRGRFTHVLETTLPPREAALARALLLGDNTATDRDEWDVFARTGVIHVLVISGQHLVVLAGFVWWMLRILGVRRRRGAWIVLLLIVGYTFLTGLRPSSVRATVMVGIACGGLLLRRPVLTANAFALAWLLIIILNPTDAFTSGCLLSFLSVFVLVWFLGPLLSPEITPMDRLAAEIRPPWLTMLRSIGGAFVAAYVVTIVLTAVNSPLVMLKQNVAPPVGVLIGPPVVVLTTVALLAGFLLLGIGLVASSLAEPFALLTKWSLSLTDAIVRYGDGIPGGAVYVPDVPVWWVIGFYALVGVIVLGETAWRKRLLMALAAWTLLGLIGDPRTTSDEFRVTFLSVGHGGCTVLETPDGRVLLYDAGSIGGPDAVRRVVAPYLWTRGIRRIDELFLSHADLDHYNGVPELLRRFPLGRVTLTPSFAEKNAAEVAEVLLALDRHRVERRIAVAGDRFTAGAVTLEVLHPPPQGPPGSENERSLVLHITHRGHSLLLTGDLEKAGTQRLLSLEPRPVDVLMAPHHGSRAASPPELLAWAAPKLLVVSRGPRDGEPDGAWDTFTNGAITLRSQPTGLTAETWRTKQRTVVKRGGK